MSSLGVKQQDSRDCGAACLASIGKYFGVRLPVARIRQMAGTDQKGTNLIGLIEAADQMGLNGKGVRTSMEKLPEIPLPAIAHMIKESNHHYIVLVGISRKKFRVMDPASGQIENWDRQDFYDQWSGILVLFSKKEDFCQTNQTVSNWRRFRRMISLHRSYYLKAFIGAILFTLLGLGISIYVQKITDLVLGQENILLLHQMSLVMLLVIILQFFFGLLKSTQVLKSGQHIDSNLVLGYFRHLLKLPQRFFDTNQVGEIISRFNDAIKIRAFINDLAIEILVNLLIVIFSFSFLLIYSPKLTLVLLMIIPLYGAIYSFVNKRNRITERRLMENAAELESILVENISQIKTIKLFGQEENAYSQLKNSFESFLSIYYRSGITTILGGRTTHFLGSLFVLILLWFGSVYVIDGLISTGELFSCYALMAYFSGPISSLISMNKTIQNALIAADRLFDIMELSIEQDTKTQKLEKSKLGNIQFDKICFGYGNRAEIFQDFSATINKGEITAIVGESGSGKSTLISLLQKLYQPKAGRILIGQYNLQNISKSDLQEIQTIVPQQLDLFAGNISENIALGDKRPDMKRVIWLCDQLNMGEMLKSFPFGLDTQIGQNGFMLSGGQRQRIALARALYREPDILLLDEANSALDAQSEDLLWSVLYGLRKKGKTIITISHQLHAIAGADRILVLESGRIVQDGTHKQLLQSRGQYYKMWRLQNQRNSQLAF